MVQLRAGGKGFAVRRRFIFPRWGKRVSPYWDGGDGHPMVRGGSRDLDRDGETLFFATSSLQGGVIMTKTRSGQIGLCRRRIDVPLQSDPPERPTHRFARLRCTPGGSIWTALRLEIGHDWVEQFSRFAPWGAGFLMRSRFAHWPRCLRSGLFSLPPLSRFTGRRWGEPPCFPVSGLHRSPCESRWLFPVGCARSSSYWPAIDSSQVRFRRNQSGSP